jgi:hypothetical protein
MRDFTVSGYLIGLDGNRFIIKVDDADVDRIALTKTILKKSSQLGNFISVNIKSARFEIANLDWSEPRDLIGAHLQIACTVKIFHVRKKIKAPSGTDATYFPSGVSTEMVSFAAKLIKNVP